jgi:uncharacterized protein (TIGR03067 family)
MHNVLVLLSVSLLVGGGNPHEDAKKELANLQGEWSMISAERDGQALPKDFVRSSKRVCKGDQIIVTIEDKVFMRATIALDPSKKPKAIDYTVTGGLNKGEKQLGIYELEGDTVKFCLAPAGKDRPTHFTAKAGSGWTLTVWKRNSK